MSSNIITDLLYWLQFHEILLLIYYNHYNEYQSVEWIEPRLNLSQDLWGPSNVESDEDLVPGG